MDPKSKGGFKVHGPVKDLSSDDTMCDLIGGDLG